MDVSLLSIVSTDLSTGVGPSISKRDLGNIELDGFSRSTGRACLFGRVE